MDFVTHLPWTPQRHDAVRVIVDRVEVGTFSSRAHNLLIREILSVVYSRGSPATWSTSIHSVV